MKQTIFGLGLEAIALKDLLDNPEFDEETGELINNDDVLAELFDGLNADIGSKLDSTMYIVREYEATADALKKEIARLTARKKASENNVDRLKSRIFELINLQEDKKFKTELNSFSIRKSESVNILDDDNISREYMKITKTADKTAIKKALKSGVVIDGAEMQTNYSLGVR